MIRTSRYLRLALATLGVLCGGALLATSAMAAKYGPATPPSFAFAPGSPAGVAINQSNKVAYVSNEGGKTIETFVESAPGTFTPGEFSGPKSSKIEVASTALYQLAVDESAGATKGDIYVSDYQDGKVFRYTEAGTAAGEISIEKATGITVDSSGDLFVAQYSTGDIFEYSSTGSIMNGGSPVAEGLTNPNSLAFNSAGDLYAAQNASGKSVVELKPKGGGLFELTAPEIGVGGAGGSLGVAVDRKTNDVFVDNTESIEEFNEAGAIVGEPFNAPGFGESNAIAVNESTALVLATNRPSNSVLLFAEEVAKAKQS